MKVVDQHAFVPLLIVLKKLGINADHYCGGYTFVGTSFGKAVTGLSHGTHHIQFTPDGVSTDGIHVVSRSGKILI